MQIFQQTHAREFPSQQLKTDLLVAGGGLAGLCAALAAARDGLKVVLVQDRPVLGGNASSEVRLWANGATSHMGNNNRWSREGGIMGEIMEENVYRNKEGNPVMFDLVLLDMARSEPHLTLLLNTALYEVSTKVNVLPAPKGSTPSTKPFMTLPPASFAMRPAMVYWGI
jgi:NADPH-dependent 2,4-dienoyl-CoA reductase/sulfur reductase-like enzyme